MYGDMVMHRTVMMMHWQQACGEHAMCDVVNILLSACITCGSCRPKLFYIIGTSSCQNIQNALYSYTDKNKIVAFINLSFISSQQ